MGLLRAKAKALMEEGVEAYHKSGDEYYSQFDTQEEADDAMKRVAKRLEESIIKVTNPDNKIRKYKGWRFSYGKGAESKSADAALRKHKRIREGTGERSGRGERPIGLVEVAEGERLAETGGKDKNYSAAKEVIAPAPKEEMEVDGNVQTTLFKGEDAAGYEGVSAVEGEKTTAKAPEAGKKIEGKGLLSGTASVDSVVVCRQAFVWYNTFSATSCFST